MQSDGQFIGQVVHYTSYGTPGGEYPSVCRAAIVAGLSEEEGVVDLVVLNPEGMFFNKGVSRDDQGRGGTWHPVHL